MRVSLFQPASRFQPSPEIRVQLLPFRFMRWNDSEVLLTSDAGEFEFLRAEDFRLLTENGLPRDTPTFRSLKAKHFIAEGPSTVPVELLATKVRTKKAFLDGFTKLHLFVVTLRCDHSCPYCQVSRVSADRQRFDMSRETALRAVELMFDSPSPDLKVEFQGGEPLLNLPLIRFIAEAVIERNRSEGRNIEFVVATNLAELPDDAIALCRQYSICVSTSLDGPAWLHNANRPRPGGDSYKRVIANIAKARAALGEDRVSALMTTTERSLAARGETPN